MATYFHGGAEMQAATGGGGSDNLQTLYLMNPNYATSSGYYEGHHQILLNSTVTPNTLSMPHQHPHQQLIGIPLSGPHHSNDPTRLSQFNNSNSNSNSNSNNNNSQIPVGMHGLALQRAHYNIWSPTSGSSQGQPGPIHDLSGQAGFRSPGQGNLSLSLSPGERGHHRPTVGGEDVRMSVTVASGPGSGNGVIIGSKYLRATQELLEEVVNVGGILDNGESSGVHKLNKAKAAVKGNDDDMAGVEHGGDGGGGESSKKGSELSTAQRQELQMKKAKLLNMLDEVEQRYRQYHTQMQVIASSFEQAAGIGSSKTYTSLALKTISKQFRCLKDAITSQIKSTSKSLGEDDNNGGVKLEGGAGSRLRFVDQQLRQQRALQQLGMMHQHNAWRPQRGLPERAVSVLRAWLFEHFLHPYPKDSDKHMLAKQTGLTRSQVSNWFINARVRLWKPMVEEMYVEEMKSHEQNGGTSEENTNTNTTTTTTTNNNGGIGSSSSKNEHNQDHYSTTTKTTMIPQQHDQHQQQQQQPEDEDNNNNAGFSMIRTHQNDQNNRHQTTNDMISSLSQSQGFTLIGSSSDMESLMARTSSQKKQRSNSEINNSPSSILSMDMEMKPIDHTRHHSSMMNSGGVGFNPYIVNDIGRYNPEQLNQSYHGNGVSLTLGLPHGDNLSMSENHQQNFFPNQGMELGRRLDIGPGEADFCGISMGQSSHPASTEYESIDIQSRKRFAAQILHDFVA